MDTFSETTARITATYLAQAALGMIMFFVFSYFSKIYVRRFLRTWSKSWLAFTLYVICSAILISPILQSNVLKLIFNYLAHVGCYFQIAFILIGTYQLVYYKPMKRKLIQFIIGIIALTSLAIVLAYNQAPDMSEQRYLLRAGSRTFIAGIGFVFIGFVVLINKKFTGGLGQKILASSFLLYGLQQLLYCVVILLSFWQVQFVQGPGIYGILDLVLLTFIGLGMVMWLLEDERSKLNKVNKELDSFLYSTSHDLRSPIASILGLTYIGKAELKEEKAREFMTLIEERVNKLNQIISDVLVLARTKKLEVKINQLSFDDLLNETISDVKFTKGATAIELIYEKNPLNVFLSDYNQMKIVLGNLISNAVKYHNLNRENPYIKVIFKRSGKKVEISVEDNGQGIPPESIKKIFDMFYRASNTSEGTGLGLYIVKEALAKINGRIDVQSHFGKGSTFSLILENA